MILELLHFIIGFLSPPHGDPRPFFGLIPRIEKGMTLKFPVVQWSSTQDVGS